MNLSRIADAFGREYGGASPSHVVRAPGRVNLIGEHIDYAGLAVLPMAIQREIRVAFRPRADHTVRVANLNAAFALRTFAIAPEIEPYPPGDWGNYLKAAAQGLAARYGELRGFDAVVDSNLPVAAGLSSSAALVVAAALAILSANGMAPKDRVDLMELLARAERYVGTRGGGMDQAICLGGRRGAAMRIAFEPLRLIPLLIPDGWRFVVAQSLVEAAKSGAAREAYNSRRRECQWAMEVMVAHLGIRGSTTYTDLLARRPASELVAAAAAALQAPLAARFTHVVTESQRVGEAASALIADDVARFGRAMNESHQSLRDDYEVSGPELDRLVDLARSAGAAGARLTGAGLGGSIVALATEASVGTVLEGLIEFYRERRDLSKIPEHVFVAEPSDAASVTTCDSRY